MFRDALIGLLFVLAAATPAVAQDRPTHELSHPPKHEEVGPSGERTETREFLDNARLMYDRAERLRESAEALRDGNRYEEAEVFDGRALDLEDQARQYERRAEDSRLPTMRGRPAPSDE